MERPGFSVGLPPMESMFGFTGSNDCSEESPPVKVLSGFNVWDDLVQVFPVENMSGLKDSGNHIKLPEVVKNDCRGDCIKLPPGYGFRPTDEELISYYLSRKMVDCSFSAGFIGEMEHLKMFFFFLGHNWMIIHCNTKNKVHHQVEKNLLIRFSKRLRHRLPTDLY